MCSIAWQARLLLLRAGLRAIQIPKLEQAQIAVSGPFQFPLYFLFQDPVLVVLERHPQALLLTAACWNCCVKRANGLISANLDALSRSLWYFLCRATGNLVPLQASKSTRSTCQHSNPVATGDRLLPHSRPYQHKDSYTFSTVFTKASAHSHGGSSTTGST